MMRWIICLIALAMLLGCGGQLEQLSVETVQNARVALTAAEAKGAAETVKVTFHTAQEMLATAETAMEAGDTERAYRLALRAYLHARIATEAAVAVREEAIVEEAQAQLTLSEESVAEVLQRLEMMRTELDTLREF